MATDQQIQQAVNVIGVCSHFKDQTPFSAVANALAEYEKNKWIPIETPPTGCSSVILKFDPADLEEIGCSNCAYTARYYLKNGSFYDCDPVDEWQIKPTHWQPLPRV